MVEQNIKSVEERLRKVVALLQRLQDTTGLTSPNPAFGEITACPATCYSVLPKEQPTIDHEADLAGRLHDAHHYDRKVRKITRHNRLAK
jgi:hypothetical protein